MAKSAEGQKKVAKGDQPLTVLITGANGFVGRHAVRAFQEAGHRVIGGVRSRSAGIPPEVEQRSYGDLASFSDWAGLVAGADLVVHLAARAHVKATSTSDEITSYRAQNLLPALSLANAAAIAGATRFVFVSSIGVNGNRTFGKPFDEKDLPNPQEPYAQSKMEAEAALVEIAKGTPLEITIVRPVLVYGPDAPGNFGALCRLVQSRLPLPLGKIDNRRSLLGVENLASLLLACGTHPAAANEVFVACDGEDISTTTLLRAIAAASGIVLINVPFPMSVLALAARLAGRTSELEKLTSDLQADNSKARSLLGWKPPLTFDEGMRAAQTGAFWKR